MNVRGMLLPVLSALAMGVSGASAQTQLTDKRTDLELLLYSGVQSDVVLGTTAVVAQIDGAQEGADGFDSIAANNLPDPGFAPRTLQLYTAPYGIALGVDARPPTSETLFNFKARVLDQENFLGVVPATAPSLAFNFRELSTNRTYKASVSVSGEFTVSGQPYAASTFIGDSPIIQLPPIKALLSGTEFATIQVDAGFTPVQPKIQLTDKRTDLEVKLLSGVSPDVVLGTSAVLAQIDGAQEGIDSFDSAAAKGLPDSRVAPRTLQIYSAPSGVQLWADARPAESETLFTLRARAVYQGNPRGIVPATAPSLAFNFEEFSTNRIYSVSVSVPKQVTVSGQPYNAVAFVGDSSTIQLPPVKELRSGTTFAIVQVSTRFARSGTVGRVLYYPRGDRTTRPVAVLYAQLSGQPGTQLDLEYSLPGGSWRSAGSWAPELTARTFNSIPNGAGSPRYFFPLLNQNFPGSLPLTTFRDIQFRVGQTLKVE